MSRNWLLILFILIETVQNFCSGEEAFNPFSPQLNKESGLENAKLSIDKEFTYENNETPSGERIIEKRRLYFNDEDANFPSTDNDRYPENNEYLERRRTNYSEPENEEELTEFQQRNTNLDNERNRFSLLGQAGNFRNADDNRSRQAFVGQPRMAQRYEWEKRGDSFGNSQSRWNEGYNFKSFENSASNLRMGNNYPGRNDEYNFKPFDNSAPNFRMGNNYPGRTPGMFNNREMNTYSDDRSQDLFNKQSSLTTLKDREMERVKTYNERPGSMQSGCVGPSDMNYCNRNAAGLWGSHFNPPERGVIINFNADCPKSGQLPGNQLMNKFVYMPKTSADTYQQSDLISSPRVNPIYYL